MDGNQLIQTGLGEGALEEARALLGQEIRIEQWTHEATRDTIRRYAWGIGDDNPLWCDPDYAAKTKWGGIIAPPTFPYTIFDAVIAPGLPDVQWIYSGADWFFEEPIRRGDEIKASGKLVDVTDVAGNKAKRMLIQTGEVLYRNQHGRVAARTLSHTFRIPRMNAEGGLRYEPRKEQRYTAEELAAIEQAVLNEERRGAEPRYWEDVQVGDQLPGTVRGPLTRMDMTCYYVGAVGTTGYKSTRLRWLYSHKARHNPEALPNNYDASYYGAVVSPSIGHQDDKIATSEIGMPGAYDNGPQRLGFMASAVTNWMGDDGFLRSYSLRVRRPVIFGDTSYFKGRVSGKRRDGGRPLVDLELWAENQLGETTAKGTATVELPTRE